MRRRLPAGFTLMELMVVVVILGVLASIAIPSFLSYMHRARGSEVSGNLSELYGAASALYASERAAQGVSATVATACIAEPTPLTPATPRPDKQPFVARGGFLQLGFSIADYVYYGYGIASVGQVGQLRCFGGSGASNSSLYTFYARGDLDGDGVLSTFEMAVGTSDANQLYHTRGLYVVDELE